MPDDGLTSFDNRRLLSSDAAGVTPYVSIFDFDSPIPQDRFNNFNDRDKIFPSSFSDIASQRTFQKGSAISTWGEASILRGINQVAPKGREGIGFDVYGSKDLPVITPTRLDGGTFDTEGARYLESLKSSGVFNGDRVPDSVGQKISEAGYQNRIERLESIYGSTNVHSLEKHGAQTTGIKQYRRVQHKDYPNPTTGAPGNKTKTASKFLTNKDHYEILRSAILQRKANPNVYDFDVTMDRNIGVNIKNLGSHKNRGPYSADYTNTARVRFDPNTGKMFTAFPIPGNK